MASTLTRVPENFYSDIYTTRYFFWQVFFLQTTSHLTPSFVRAKLAKNGDHDHLHRSHRCRRAMVIHYSPSSCGHGNTGGVQILALVCKIDFV